MSDEERWELPLKHRWSKENADFAELVRVSELKQAEWSQKFNQPFASKSSRDIELGRAVIIAHGQGPTIERAEAWAIMGRYDKAMELDSRPATGYAEIWQALTEPTEWCGHGTGPRIQGQHPQYREREIWSIFTNSWSNVLRCSECGHRQVGPLPKHLVQQEERRAEFKRLVDGGLGPHEALAQINAN